MSPAGPARLLVVDDEPSVLETIVALLAGEGYAVEGAGSVDEALARFEARPAELVLTDLRLDGSSGLTLIAELQRRRPDTTVIILTGYASLDSAVDALRKGAYDYLLKPCDVEELKATVARAVERSALARDLRARMADLDEANAKLRALSEELQRRVDEATAQLSEKVRELDETNRRLEEAQRQRERFISMVVHELRQPLTTIYGYAQIVVRQQLPSRARERLERILAEVARLNRLVQDLSDASNLAAGRFHIYPDACDLAQIVRDQVELARTSATDHEIRLDAPPSVRTSCDRDRVAQVVSNLLTNALKYTPGGTIHVALGVEDGEAVVSVRDEGPGIPGDRLEAIFQAHVRLDGTPSGARGSGLGLYIARGIIEAHGGRIWAESAPGVGATFKVALPLLPAEPVGAAKEGRHAG